MTSARLPMPIEPSGPGRTFGGEARSLVGREPSGLSRMARVEAPMPAETAAGAVARWHLLTGEYPPQAGGVADYSALVAAGLAGTGAEVHVWAPPAEAEQGPDADGVTVHRQAGRWTPADLARLDVALDAFPAPRRLLVQYTPNAWGRKGANLGFCRWLERRRDRGDQVWTMIHESAYPWTLRDKPTRLVLAAVHRLMLRALLRASDRVFFSTLAMERRLRRYGPGGRRPIVWLPVPSNVPVVHDPEGVAALKRRLAPTGERIIGHFGTFSAVLGRALRPVLTALLNDRPGRVALLLGRNGEPFAEELRAASPGLAGRLIATGGLEPSALSLHLQACDLLIQPYNDGVSTRRGSVMAGLAHGRPIVSNLGINTEPIWPESAATALAPAFDPSALVGEVEAVLADPARRARLGADGLAVYDRHFALQRTIEAMTAD